jgi:hypothetical protein
MEYLEQVEQLLLVFWNESLIRWILLTVGVNVIVGLLAALSAGEFNLQKLGEFLYRKILPLGGTYAVFWVYGRAVPDMAPLGAAAFAVLEAKLLADLAESLGVLGVPWPDAIKQAVSKD